MKQIVFIAAMLVAAALLPAQSASPAGSNSDQNFLKTASETNKAEMQLARLAEKKTSNNAVKQFAERMITDHTKLEQETQSVASKESVTLPRGAGAANYHEYQELASKSGSDFDKAYIEFNVKAHEQAISEFQKEASSGANAAIKALASQAVPILKEHLRLAESTAKELGISPAGPSE